MNPNENLAISMRCYTCFTPRECSHLLAHVLTAQAKKRGGMTGALDLQEGWHGVFRQLHPMKSGKASYISRRVRTPVLDALLFIGWGLGEQLYAEFGTPEPGQHPWFITPSTPFSARGLRLAWWRSTQRGQEEDDQARST